MPIHRIEHFFVLTDDIETTKRFYCEALGFTEGFRPELGFAGYWLYADEIPCIHIGEREGYARFTAEFDIPYSKRAESTGPVDHIAFNATRINEIRSRLESLGVDYKQNTLADIGLSQIFVDDPNGITIELNFRAA